MGSVGSGSVTWKSDTFRDVTPTPHHAPTFPFVPCFSCSRWLSPPCLLNCSEGPLCVLRGSAGDLGVPTSKGGSLLLRVLDCQHPRCSRNSLSTNLLISSVIGSSLTFAPRVC